MPYIYLFLRIFLVFVFYLVLYLVCKEKNRKKEIVGAELTGVVSHGEFSGRTGSNSRRGIVEEANMASKRRVDAMVPAEESDQLLIRPL